jgi:hypothetical protein
MKWARIAVAGIGTTAALFLVVTLVTTGYAFKLAFEVQGAPDRARIAQFAEHFSRSSWRVLQILVTVPAAVWAVRNVQRGHQRHGALVGLVVAATGFVVSFTISWWTMAEWVLTVGAGWLGGAIVAHRHSQQDSGQPGTRSQARSRAIPAHSSFVDRQPPTGARGAPLDQGQLDSPDAPRTPVGQQYHHVLSKILR